MSRHVISRTPAIRRLVIYLVKPSNYDEDGYVIRYWRGVLPSNTLACLYGLTEDVRERQALGPGLQWRIELVDDTVQRADVRAMRRCARQPGTHVIVCLVGVQSNQFARASDVALALRAGGVDVLIGGFHVSGSLAMLPQTPPEIQALLDAGVSVVAGEIEGRWEGILRDALAGTLRPIYNFLRAPPALQSAPMPRIARRYLRHFVASHFATLDCGRGCPFSCSFCTVINVQGRVMRVRAVEQILATIRDNYRRKVSYYFFTDDNFCRNKHWEAIFDGLIRLRKEGVRISFMMQVDTQSYQLPRFITKAAAAGCSQVFIGLESLNPQNLAAAGKSQNRVEHFRALVEAYRASGIITHIAYIIGFPFDTPASVRQDLACLQQELGPEQVSFFMLTPLPGSRDHVELLRRGAYMHPDLNGYDSFHAVTHHPRMTDDEWTVVYQDAWRSFYSVENMQAILRRVSPRNYWGVFMNFLWYKNAILVERGHPMVHGFLRCKGRRDRRPGWPVESRWQYVTRRASDFARYLVLWPRLTLEMEELWLQTRTRTALEQRVIEELQRRSTHARHWRDLRLAELQRAYHQAVAALQQTAPPRVQAPRRAIPSRVWLWIQQRNVFAHSLTCSRQSLQQFWRKTGAQLRRGRLGRVHVSALAFNVAQEASLFTAFLTALLARVVPPLLRRLIAPRDALR